MNIVYHTRKTGDIKVTGGSFSGSFDWQTVNRLVTSQFDVVIKPSGSASFVDKEGREVSLYVTVDPLKTVKGIDARRVKNEQLAVERRKEEAKEREVNELIASMTNDELLERLRG